MKLNLKYVSAFVFAATILSGCNSNSKKPGDVLAGKTSRTWRISKQINANGEKEKLTESEKNEKINIYTDGKFSVVSDKETKTGTWSVQDNTEPTTFVMQYENQPVTESFAITEVENDKVSLKSGDGSLMVLKED